MKNKFQLLIQQEQRKKRIKSLFLINFSVKFNLKTKGNHEAL